MRYLKSKGIDVFANGKKINIRFTLKLIDELQDKVEISVLSLIASLMNEKIKATTVSLILGHITGEELNIDENLDYYCMAILAAFNEGIRTKPIEVKRKKMSKQSEEIEFIDVEYFFYLGKVVLGFTEDEAWNKTPGEIKTIHDQHAIYNGWLEENKEVSIDEAIPF